MAASSWTARDASCATSPKKDFGPATRVREGKCVVWDKDAFGYIDLIGQLVIPPRFKLAWPFYQGLAQIATSTGVGFIDHAGQEVIPSRYAFAAHFEQNLVCVRDAKTTYLINRSGQVVWPK